MSKLSFCQLKLMMGWGGGAVRPQKGGTQGGKNERSSSRGAGQDKTYGRATGGLDLAGERLQVGLVLVKGHVFLLVVVPELR